MSFRPEFRRTSTRLNLVQLEERENPSTGASQVFGNVVLNSSTINVSGVAVQLKGVDNGGNAVNVSAITTAGGQYQFTNVIPGSYQLSVGTIPGLSGVISPVSLNTVAGTDSQQDLTFHGGVSPDSISLRQFLNQSTVGDLSLPAGGSGIAQVNYRDNNAPVVSHAIADMSVAANSAAKKINLVGVFSDADTTNSEVIYHITNDGVQSTLRVGLFDTTAPQTVANYFDYVKSGAYNDTFFTRLVSNFVLQGGGAKLNAAGDNITAVPKFDPVPNEFGASNTPNTLAMALGQNAPNSGTSEYFFNLVDNSATLDPQSFTVFGALVDNLSKTNLNTLAQTTVLDESARDIATGNNNVTPVPVNLQAVPLSNYGNVNFPGDAVRSNYMTIDNIEVSKQDEFMTFSAVSSNPALVSISMQNEWMSLSFGANQTGTSTITVTAKDRYGVPTTQSFVITVS